MLRAADPVSRPAVSEPWSGPVARAAELAALGHRGPLTPDDVERAARALADDPDPRVRAAAVGAVVRGGDVTAPRTAVIRAMADPAPAVRRRGAELAAGLSADDDVVRALVVALDDRDVTVVEAAAWALGELGQVAIDAGAVTGLARIVNDHRDAIAREAAVAALGALGDPSGLPAILVACSDRAAVRRRAVLALAPFAGPEVDTALARALDDKDWQVRQAAEDLTSGAT
jgi:HEAT repeat protein